MNGQTGRKYGGKHRRRSRSTQGSSRRRAGVFLAVQNRRMDRSQTDDSLQRTALASLVYYPEIQVDDPEYTLDSDIDWCMEPLTELPDDVRTELRDVIGRTITNPTAHRAELTERFAILSGAIDG